MAEEHFSHFLGHMFFFRFPFGVGAKLRDFHPSIVPLWKARKEGLEIALPPKKEKPGSRINTGFPGINAKIALRYGELFLYQSLHFDLVRETGLEPVRHTTHAPQTCLSANSSTRAFTTYAIIPSAKLFCQVK